MKLLHIIIFYSYLLTSAFQRLNIWHGIKENFQRYFEVHPNSVQIRTSTIKSNVKSSNISLLFMQYVWSFPIKPSKRLTVIRFLEFTGQRIRGRLFHQSLELLRFDLTENPIKLPIWHQVPVKNGHSAVVLSETISIKFLGITRAVFLRDTTAPDSPPLPALNWFLSSEVSVVVLREMLKFPDGNKCRYGISCAVISPTKDRV